MNLALVEAVKNINDAAEKMINYSNKVVSHRGS